MTTWELYTTIKELSKSDGFAGGEVSISSSQNAFTAPPGNAYYGIRRRKKVIKKNNLTRFSGAA